MQLLSETKNLKKITRAKIQTWQPRTVLKSAIGRGEREGPNDAATSNKPTDQKVATAKKKKMQTTAKPSLAGNKDSAEELPVGVSVP